MKALLDTHFVLWITQRSRSLARHRWVDRYRPWGVSPVSLVEIAMLTETGRVYIDPHYVDELARDERFVIDDLSLLVVARHAMSQSWTRDAFDRLLAGHSLARRVPLCTIDRHIIQNHSLLPSEVTR